MSIGDRIKERRIELGITQEELAKKMGYKSRSSINKIELGINDIPQSKIVKFAQILRVSPGYLMEWEQKKKKVTIIDDEQKEENITSLSKYPELEKILDEMNEEGVQKVYSYAVDISNQYKKRCSHRMVEGEK